jgi:hypothetical protein
MSSLVLAGTYTAGRSGQLRLLISEMDGVTPMTDAPSRLSSLTLTHVVKASGAIVNECANRNIMHGHNGSTVYAAVQGTEPHQYNVLVELDADDLDVLGAEALETHLFQAEWEFDTDPVRSGGGNVEAVLAAP